MTLAWEQDHHEAPLVRCQPTAEKPSCMHLRGHVTKNRVHFGPLVTVHLFHKHKETTTVVPHEAFKSWPWKPWRLDLDDPTNDTWGVGAPLSAQAVLSPSPTHDSGFGVSLSTQAASNPSPTQHMDSQSDGDHEQDHETGSMSSSSSWRSTPPDASAPPWVRQIWRTIFCPQSDRDHRYARPTITLLTWYLGHQHCRLCQRSRTVILDDAWEHWMETLCHTWRDTMYCDEEFEIQIVQPEPHRGSLEFHQSHIVITQHRQQEYSIVLSATFETLEGPKQLFRLAAVVPQRITKLDVLALLPGQQLPRAHEFWVIHDHNLIAYEPQAIAQAASIEAICVSNAVPTEEVAAARTRTFAADDVAGLEEDDVANFLARQLGTPRASEDPLLIPTQDEESDEVDFSDGGNEIPADATWEAVVLYSLSYSPVHARLRWNDYEILHRQAAYQLRLSRHDIVTLHDVSHPPRDMQNLEVPLLVQCEGELRPGSTAKYVLIDIEFHEHPPALDPDTHRCVKLMVAQLTRTMVLSVLGLVPYCHHVGDVCLMWHNHAFVRTDFHGALNFAHGDYIRICVPPSPVCGNIRTRLAALIHHHDLGPADYTRIMDNMPDHMDLEQMPNPEPYIRHLPFHDEQALLQISTHKSDASFRLQDDSYLEAVRSITDEHRDGERPDPDRDLMQQLAELPATLRDLHGHYLRLAFAHPDLAPHFGIMTWYLSHTRARRCNLGRFVELSELVASWPGDIAHMWRDEIDAQEPISYYIVHPQPYELEQRIAAHVLLVQHEYYEDAALLFTLFDNMVHEGRAIRFASVHAPVVHHSDILRECDREVVCAAEEVICTSWYGWRDITRGPPLEVNDGFGLTLAVQRPQEAPKAQTPIAMEQPPEPSVLCLDRLLSLDGRTCIVHMIAAQQIPHLPSHLEMPVWYNTGTIAEELMSWGHFCHVYKLGKFDTAFCVPWDWNPPADQWHYLYANDDTGDSQGAFPHSDTKHLGETDHMRLLHQLGYQRAAILNIQLLRDNLYLVEFKNVQGQLEVPDKKNKTPSTWPPPQRRSHVPARVVERLQGLEQDDDRYVLRFRRSLEEIRDFLHSSPPLCQDWSYLQLEPHVQQALQDTPLWHAGIDIDRLIIYTDGSSSGQRHSVPDRSDDPNSPCDTWAFVVLGERYAHDEEPAQQYFLGWQAHPVMYHTDKDFYIGTDHIGSEAAEKEALFWALHWRIGCGLSFATCMRPDNLTAAGQAQGLFGTHHMDLSHRCLRGAYQLLSALLPDDGLCVHHVRSHTNEPWNDLADHLAKQEAKKSFYLKRPNLDIKLWWDDLPYLWTLFDDRAGLPQLTQSGHCPRPPQLPDLEPHFSADVPQCHQEVHYALSLASLNVQSLYKGPDGHGGKVHYLRKQMLDQHLLFLGLQETRSETGSSKADSVLRLAGGSKGHLYGVELWVNLRQPFAYVGRKAHCFDSRDFVVVHTDPCLMIVHVTNPLLDAWLVVAHGPQSGRPAPDRTQWWTHVQKVLETHTTHAPLFLMIDANAAAGPDDALHVGEHGDAPTVNTPLWRDFLQATQLCLPSTFACHTGSHETWTRGDGAISRRIDFVAIPCHMLSNCHFSQVLENFDTGQEFDHSAVAIELKWIQTNLVDQPVEVPTLRTNWRADCIKTLPSDVLQSIAPTPWTSDIGTQVDDFNSHIHRWLQQGHAHTAIDVKKPYIDAEIWTLRTHKLQAGRAVKHINRQLKLHCLRTVFSHWRSKPGHICEQEENPLTPPADLLCRAVAATARLCVKCWQLRWQLKTAKQRALQECLDSIPSNADANCILRAIKPHVGPSNPKKQKRSALPMVGRLDGNLCCTATEALDRWIEHFMLMEGGQRLDREQQHQLWREGLADLQADSIDLHWDQLPSLLDMEVACRGVALGKATGPDGVPSDALHRFAPQMAKLLYPQLLKLCLHGQEALIHKGGRLATAYKWKGAQDCCESYRSLLVHTLPKLSTRH